MTLLLLLLSILQTQGPPDPASVTLAVADTPEGFLFTDGRHSGLFLYRRDLGTVVLSTEPGAGRNVLVTGAGILFKECPTGGMQQVVLWSPEGVRSVLYSEAYFSGPFRGEGESFLVASGKSVAEMDSEGRVLAEWSISCYPASVVLSGQRILYTLEEGGLSFAETVSDRCFTSLSTGPGGLVLAEMSPCGFLVYDVEDRLLMEEEEGLFPSWTPDGSILYSEVTYSGPAPVSGRIMTADPTSGDRTELMGGPVPLHPVRMMNGRLAWTGDDGMLRGIRMEVPLEPREVASAPESDEPASHFDVVYMHQRWDTPDWFNGSWSCGPTSCVMATQYYLRLTPDSIWASYPSPGHWSQWGNYIPEEYTFLGYTYDELGESPSGLVPGAHGFICPDGGAWWNLMVEFLNRHQVYSAWAGTSWPTLTGEIDSLYPVVCSSSVLGYGHIILMNGYYDDHTVVVNDPYGDANEPGWGNYYNGKDVLYDWPGYNNGHVQIGVSQLFYARAAVPSDPDTLVDDCSRGFFKYSDCRYWHLTGSGFQGNAWWTYSTGAPPDTCVAEWHPVLPSAGDYEVMVYIPPDRSTATGIYQLKTAYGIEELVLDQGAYSDQWVSLGTFPLNADSYLRLGDHTGTSGEYLAFDAALFSPEGTGLFGVSHERSDNLRTWPNPCRRELSIGVPWAVGSLSLGVYDLSGRLIILTEATEESGVFLLDTSGLRAGVYLLRVSGPGNDPLSRLITVTQ